MIHVALNGGLGNQLFQYAAARALAERHHTAVSLDLIPLYSKLQVAQLATFRSYELGCFDIKARLEQPVFKGKYLYPLSKIHFWYRQQLNRVRYRYYRETDFAYQEAFGALPDETYLDGHFQSEKYFTSIEATLRKELRFVHPLDSRNAALLDKIRQVQAVSLHIRRGDYVLLKKNLQKHGITPMSYYQDAVAYITQKVTQPHFFLFSDDPDWVSDNVKLEYPHELVRHNVTPEDAWKDMQLMAACRHHIICNSTFSWWGAWLNPAAEKIVIAPRAWFRDASINSGDIYPPEWIKL